MIVLFKIIFIYLAEGADFSLLTLAPRVRVEY